ncbi:MAG: HAMP domain-containing protein, partial [Rhodospirillales bacterium]|nr:HAMP domain-containing protein [Rhodospirillales bacterium]
MRKSIRTRLTAAFIGLAALPLLLAGGTLAWRSFQIQQREALVAQMQSARMLATEIRAFIEGRLAEMELLVRMEGLEDKSAMRIGEVLTALVSHRPDIAEAVWLDAEGRERARESRLEVVTAAELRDRSGWEALRWVREQGRPWFGPVRFESQTGEPLMTVVVPARSPRGVTVGALAVDLRLKKVWERVAAPDLSGQTLMVVDAQGWVVAHRNPSLVLRGTRIVLPTAPGLSQGIDGGAVLAAPELLVFGSQRLVVLAERSLWQALDLALQTVLVVAVVILAALSAAVGLVMLAQRSILKPLHGLAVVAGQIGDGDLNRLAPVESGDEIGTLAVAFNTMTARLRRSLHSLEERIAEQRVTEAALLHSQEELRQAKADLERRVAERTLDLSQAQQQLAEAI